MKISYEMRKRIENLSYPDTGELDKYHRGYLLTINSCLNCQYVQELVEYIAAIDETLSTIHGRYIETTAYWKGSHDAIIHLCNLLPEE